MYLYSGHILMDTTYLYLYLDHELEETTCLYLDHELESLDIYVYLRVGIHKL